MFDIRNTSLTKFASGMLKDISSQDSTSQNFKVSTQFLQTKKTQSISLSSSETSNLYIIAVPCEQRVNAELGVNYSGCFRTLVTTNFGIPVRGSTQKQQTDVIIMTVRYDFPCFRIFVLIQKIYNSVPTEERYRYPIQRTSAN